MGYISAILMTNTTSEDALLIMVTLINNYELNAIFSPGFPGLRESIFIHNNLLKKYMPKLHQKFEDEFVIAESYCTHWYMTLFSVYFPIDVVVRIWDIYLIEGRKTIFRISLAIIKLNEKALFESEMGECL